MLAKRLLELSAEYLNHGQDTATLASVGLEPPRTVDEIAEEYGRTLKDFLAD
ncbi:hypothetical protein [Arthrobacter luteolus]|uniref:hypothetical protein n=1 Tax=Arthrobacter luteolus TaxID=98672 RepID=UPI000A6E6925|nr:hypothetical protein [Arthrobacter luteolus]